MGHAQGPPRAATGMEQALLEIGLAYPEAWEDHPWGERALKVKKKVFAFLSQHTGVLALSVKLPSSSAEALLLPFVEPTGYGLGKSGWITARVPAGTAPLSLLAAWVDESYRAVAPKTLVKQLDAAPAPRTSKLRKKA